MTAKANNHQKNKTGKTIDEAREAAAEIVYSVMENDSYANLSLEQAFQGKSLSALDRSFATAISYGTITRIFNIDAIFAKYSSLAPADTEPWIRTIVRIGIWQIFWSDSIPDFAICDESVKLAKKYSNPGAASFVNGLLRKLIRDKEAVMSAYITNPKEFWLKSSLSRELAGYFIKWFGESRALSICDSLNQPPHITARINKTKTGSDMLIDELEEAGCKITDAVFMDAAFMIRTNGVMMDELQSFKDGRFVIQDEAAMLVGVIADPKPGEKVIDLCSAPGGKACHIAELMENRGEILACDIHPGRLSLVEQNAQRLGIGIIECICADACDLSSGILKENSADIVLADVPCSGLGILGKKPDIRINMTHNKMISLYPIQKKILENAARLVKPGGNLIYSTCTLNPMENERQIQEFLENNAGIFEKADITGLLPEQLLMTDQGFIETARDGMITLYPDKHGCDGFFIAKLRKTGEKDQ
ncbi:MAG: 16S rRNA (cytosine(967)-C(5))-methyltransferase RsmB [Saccharofermentanales bacterium]